MAGSSTASRTTTAPGTTATATTKGVAPCKCLRYEEKYPAEEGGKFGKNFHGSIH
ncbi:hypothetical protein ACFQY0_10430 [Haloferula chungangensis]|uniref:Uncharacterized protein n=1 Tax=Haloferula chungangensis TaxID=1048331 RepID=A0ABW2L8K6_9BACT